MRRGFTGGLIWGIAAAVFCLFCLIAYQSMQPEESPDTTTLEVPAGSEFNQSRDDNSIKKLTAISTADRAQIIKSDLIEPTQGSDIDRAIGSSAKTPDAESRTLSSLENSASNNSQMAIQKPALLGEKPTFTVRNIQRPLAPRAEGAISVNSDSALPLPKEEIALEQKIEPTLPELELGVSVDPSGPIFGYSSTPSANIGSTEFVEQKADVVIPVDDTTSRVQFSELELQVSPKLPDADFSGMTTDDTSGFGQISLPQQSSDLDRDTVQNIDFKSLKDGAAQSLFSNPDLPLAPKAPNLFEGGHSDLEGPQLRAPASSMTEGSQLSEVYSNIKNEQQGTLQSKGVSNTSLLIQPHQSSVNLIMAEQAIKPKTVEQDLSVSAFGANQANQIGISEGSRVQTVTRISNKSNEIESSTKITPSDLDDINIPSLELDAPRSDSAKKATTIEQSDISDHKPSRDQTSISGAFHNNNKRPIDAFSAPKVSRDGKPLLAIVLIIDEKHQIDYQALKDIPFPLTIAVSSSSSNVEEMISYYRSKGFEVAVQVDYTRLSSTADIETILTSSVTKLSETVAVMEGRPGSFQKTRAHSEKIAKILSESGHGLLIYEKGLNTLVQTANKLDVPVRTIYRNLNQLGGDPRKIRRFLDGAAFRARQSGENSAVVVTANLHPETLGALLIWSMQDRSKSVALGPLSQALTISDEP